MLYYECYQISKSYNFNAKLNYIFNNMENQALVMLVEVCVTMTTPKSVYLSLLVHMSPYY
jgi:hypothetical protein